MLSASTDIRGDTNTELRIRLARLRAENERLRAENRDLRTAVDAHVRRAGRSGLFGSLELTAGTCVGSGRRRTQCRVTCRVV